MSPRRVRQSLLGEDGFTLAEVVIAIGILTIGIVGVGATLVLQAGGLSSGSNVGLAAVTRGYYASTAAMLAQERIELLKNTAYADIASLTEDYSPGMNPIAGYPNFKRVTTATDTSFPVGAKTYTVKQVTVQVFFKPPTESGLGQETSVKLVTLIAQRP